MNEIMKDLTGVAMAIVGVAILAVIVSKQSKTTAVIQNSAVGFSQVLGVAMGGGTSNISSYAQ